MDELVAWLREQLDKDAARAEEAAAVRGGHWSAQSLQSGRREPHYYVGASPHESVSRSDSEVMSGGAAFVLHAATHDPARVLREIDADRQLLTLYAEVAANDVDDVEYAHGWANALGMAVRLRASAFSDRPGYREEWRP